MAGRALDAEVAVEGFDAVAEAAESGGVGVGAADAVVGDLDGEPAVRARDVDGRLGGVCVFGDVGERFGGDEVGGGLDRGGEAVGADGRARRGRARAGRARRARRGALPR